MRAKCHIVFLPPTEGKLFTTETEMILSWGEIVGVIVGVAVVLFAVLLVIHIVTACVTTKSKEKQRILGKKAEESTSNLKICQV